MPHPPKDPPLSPEICARGAITVRARARGDDDVISYPRVRALTTHGVTFPPTGKSQNIYPVYIYNDINLVYIHDRGFGITGIRRNKEGGGRREGKRTHRPRLVLEHEAVRVVLGVEDVGDELEAHPLEVSDAEVVVVGVHEVGRVVVRFPSQFQEPVPRIPRCKQESARARTSTGVAEWEDRGEGGNKKTRSQIERLQDKLGAQPLRGRRSVQEGGRWVFRPLLGRRWKSGARASGQATSRLLAPPSPLP